MKRNSTGWVVAIIVAVVTAVSVAADARGARLNLALELGPGVLELSATTPIGRLAVRL
ncbi:MAG: hypothetical protein AB7O98_17635 [Hyphomonadaceae bacterium]